MIVAATSMRVFFLITLLMLSAQKLFATDPSVYEVNVVNIGKLGNDTSKPNAVYILPAFDYNYAFSEKEMISFYQSLKKDYDVVIAKVSNRSELKRILLSIPEIDVLIISGHGTQRSLNLSIDYDMERYAKNIIKEDDPRQLDISDDSLSESLTQLTPHATIVLISCLNAHTGFLSRKNMASYLSQMSGGKRVIAAKKSFSIAELVQGVPLKVRLWTLHPDGSQKEDVTRIYE